MGKSSQVNPIGTDRLTLEESAYLELRRLITTGGLKPGERISVNAMAQQLQVSRIPVIHALRRLASEGFVELHPHRNVTVMNPTLKELRGHGLMLCALEEIAINEAWPLRKVDLDKMAALHQQFRAAIAAGEMAADIDYQFHRIVWEESGLAQLNTTLETLWNLGAYYRLLSFQYHAGQFDTERFAEHEAIIQAFAQGDPEQAVERLRVHRQNAMKRVEQVVQHYKNTPPNPE